VGGIFALLVRIELFSRGKTIIDAETYNRFFTLHGAIMVFLFIIPSVPAALGNFFLPIMIGAKDVAFPKLNLLSFYIYLCGACDRSLRASSWARSTRAGRSTRRTACRRRTASSR
jgi:cytochrome c oxidase subunit 1